MGRQERAVCPENEALVEYVRKWWKEYPDKHPQHYSPNLENTIKRAFTNICLHKSPITSLKHLKDIKYVGKWMLKEMQEFFKNLSVASENDNSPTKGKKTRGKRSYVPGKNTAPYALLITLYRAEKDGLESMRRQELIDAAEASGLSRGPIAPEIGRGKPGHFGSSTRERYSGWSGMKTLIDKGLVTKSSCPAKYKLSDEGRRKAIECLSRSGMLDSAQSPVSGDECLNGDNQEHVGMVDAVSPEERTPMSVDLNTGNGTIDDIPVFDLSQSSSPTTIDDIPEECLEKFRQFGFSREQVQRAWSDVSVSSLDQDISKLWLTVLCRLREDEVYGFQSELQGTVHSRSGDASSYGFVKGEKYLESGVSQAGSKRMKSSANFEMRASSSRPENHMENIVHLGSKASQIALRMPPLGYLDKFGDTYKVILILDDREPAVRSKSRSIVERISSEFKIEIEVRRLPVGDAMWIARHKQLHTEYVLDFIVERKNVGDLRSSIRDNRYKDQKLRLLRTGIKKIIYLVEGDPNACEGADSIKTACFTTEILDGIDVQRTSSLGDTFRRLGFLTLAITDQYKLNSSLHDCEISGDCLEYARYIKQCNNLDKMTVSDVFATQLMQVSQVTEEVAAAVLDCYPTLFSLASAYALIKDGNIRAQEELLNKQSKGAVGAAASRNIFRFIWAS